MLARFKHLTLEADSLAKKGRYYDAAVTREQALHIAKEYGLREEGFSAQVWSAHDWEQAGRPIRALGLLMDALRDEPSSDKLHERWVARKRFLEIKLDYTPDLGSLQKRLDKLKLFHQENPTLPIHDISYLEAYLKMTRGEWKQALKLYELSWSQHNDRGYLKFAKAYFAALCNLRLRKLAAAKRWCDLLGRTEAEWKVSRVAWNKNKTYIALYRQAWGEADKFAAQAEKLSDNLQITDSYEGVHIRIRTLLLQPEYGDPAIHGHPARYRLLQRGSGKKIVFHKYDRALLIVDYRLASVRYLLGVEPVDDFWYTQAQVIPTELATHFSGEEFQARLLRARRAIKRAMSVAEYVDRCFECDWRQQEVQKRNARLDDLAEAVQQVRNRSWQK